MSITFDTSDIQAAIHGVLASVVGTEKAAALEATADLQAFNARVSPLLLAIANDKAAGVGDPDTAISMVLDSAKAEGWYLAEVASIAQEAAFAAAMRTAISVVALFIGKVLNAATGGLATVVGTAAIAGTSAIASRDARDSGNFGA